jgi:hypothetical protein
MDYHEPKTIGHDPKAVWKAGVPLNTAWLHFAAAAAREAHLGKPGFSGTVQQLVSVASSTRNGKLILSALQTVGKAHLDELESRTLLQRALVDVLARGRLIATGCVKNGAPVAMAAEAFEQAFDHAGPDWDNAVVHFDGATYTKVRITNPADIRQPAPRKSAPVLAIKARSGAGNAAGKAAGKAGAKVVPAQVSTPVDAPATAAPLSTPAAPATARSKASESIRAAIARLIAADSGIGETTRKQAAQMIRDQIGMAYEKGNGLSDPNLARHVRKVVGVKARRA